MSVPIQHVLFICTGNSARSVLAEGPMNQLGAPRFCAHLAGSHPIGIVNPFALSKLKALHIPTAGYRSKNWDEFAQPDAPKIDFVFTVATTPPEKPAHAGQASR